MCGKCGLPIKAIPVAVEKRYGYASHSHCWDQKQPSACGIPLEEHEQCCLCDMKPPQPALWEENPTYQTAERLLEAIYSGLPHSEARHEVMKELAAAEARGRDGENQAWLNHKRCELCGIEMKDRGGLTGLCIKCLEKM